MSDVYFLKIKKQDPETLGEAGEKISKIFSSFFNKNDKVAIKVHFGERGSKTYLSPILVKAIYNRLQAQVEKAVLTDCTVLYKGERSLGSSHKKLALDQGFGFAPILIADGEKGEEEIKITINQKHFKEIKVGAGIKDFNAILAISHFTGHLVAGFGAAIKNVGMGLGSKGGKMAMHQAFRLKINPETCRGCQGCQKECSAGAIFMENNKAQIDYQKCIGCGICISICPFGAVEIPFGVVSSKELQERIAEYAFGILKEKKAFFINVWLNITPRCDCMKGDVQKPMMPDIGILASKDIVAVDQASLDLTGKEKFQKGEIDPSCQINYAEKLGLGERKYKLVEIE